MPLDYRRFNGPEDSVSYKRFTPDFLKNYDAQLSELLEKNNLKDEEASEESERACKFCMYFITNYVLIDNYKVNTNPFLFLVAKTDTISQAKGSSYVEIKNTKVICSVFDPREIPHQNEFRLVSQQMLIICVSYFNYNVTFTHFSHLGQIYCEVKFAPFSCSSQRRPPAPDAEDKALSEALRQAIEPAVCRHLFPNYQVIFFI